MYGMLFIETYANLQHHTWCLVSFINPLNNRYSFTGQNCRGDVPGLDLMHLTAIRTNILLTAKTVLADVPSWFNARKKEQKVTVYR